VTDTPPKNLFLSRERWQMLEPLLDAALALPPERRTAFLAESCGANDAMRDELARMLIACERTGGGELLARPAAERCAALWTRADDDTHLADAVADRYTLEDEAGRGGMAVVYRARDLRHQRPVAFKVLRTALGDHGLTRFRREVALAAKLQHPHIVPVFDSGENAGRVWYTMPFIDGETLGARLRRETRLDIAESVRLLREIADALDYAHRHGVVHRDLKPDNVLLSGDHAVITDFGVAKALAAATHGEASDADDEATAVGVMVGTPAYMAPEQAAADPAIDHRADLYALGVIAYEMLTGVAPFREPSRQALLAAHLAERPAPVATHRDDVPPALERLVMQLLEKRAADRPSSAADVLVALGGGSGALPDEGTSPPATKRRSKQLARSGWRWAIGAAAVVVAAAVTTWAIRAIRAPSPQRVLIVPLENTSNDSSIAYLGRGAADWILQSLATTGFVDAIPDTSQRRGSVDLATLAAARRASFVVWGIYYVAGDSIRVQLRVQNVVTGAVLPGSIPISVPRAAPLALSEPIRSQVLAMLATRLDPENVEWSMGALPTNLEAYNEYLTGIDQISLGNPFGAIDHWRRAAALDTSFMQPLLHAAATLSAIRPAAADSLVQEVERQKQLTPGDRALLNLVRGLVRGRLIDALEGAQAFVRAEPKAQLPYFFLENVAVRVNRPRVALDAAKHVKHESGRFRLPTSALLHFTVLTEAHHLLSDHKKELAAARTVRELHPNSRDILALEVRALAALGRIDEMTPLLGQLEAMPREDSLSPPTASLLLVFAGELAAHHSRTMAQRLIERAASEHEPVGGLLAPAAQASRGRALYLLGRWEEAASVFDSVVARPESIMDPFYPSFLAWSAAAALRLERRSDVDRIASRLETLRRDYDQGITAYSRAILAAQRHDTAAALRLLEQSLREGMPANGVSIHNDLMLEPLWKTPEFRELLRPRG
jgi:serine/threonine protein kinase/tetratricopeptide (TPR) repeat protein